jgi:hypothetical protein
MANKTIPTVCYCIQHTPVIADNGELYYSCHVYRSSSHYRSDSPCPMSKDHNPDQIINSYLNKNWELIATKIQDYAMRDDEFIYQHFDQSVIFEPVRGTIDFIFGYGFVLYLFDKHGRDIYTVFHYDLNYQHTLDSFKLKLNEYIKVDLSNFKFPPENRVAKKLDRVVFVYVFIAIVVICISIFALIHNNF